MASNFIKNRPQHRCFPVRFANFLRTPLFTVHFRWLLLKIMNSSSYLRVLPIVAKNSFTNSSTTNDFAVCKHCNGTLLLAEDVTSSNDFGNQNYIFQKGARLFNRSTQNMPYFYVTLHKISNLTSLVTILLYTEKVSKALFL